MKEKTDIHKFENTIDAVNNLSEKDAKSLLKIIYGFVHTAMTADGGNEVKVEMINKLSDMYKQMPELNDLKVDKSIDIVGAEKSFIPVSKNEQMKEYPQTAHIVFGNSTAGSLRYAFRHTTFAKTEEIIVIPDILSVGPIKLLQTKEGIENRFQWFKRNYRDDFNELEEYKQGMFQAIEKIKRLPPNQKVIIWTCENAAEQTGLRIVLLLFENKANEIFELNTYKTFHKLYTYPILEEEQFPRSSGELNSEKLLQFYKQFERKSMNLAKRKALNQEGRNLLLVENYLRTWEYGELKLSRIEEGDDFIIDCARKLHKEKGMHDYMKAARLIGEVIGCMQQYAGDEWIEYRLRALISKEIFEYRGDLSAMRLYDVRLKKELLH